jgi:ribosomal protein L16 Arg81 hydroxylase
MLDEWLKPDDTRWFMENHFGKAPCARPGAAITAFSLWDWDIVDHLLKQESRLDLLTVTQGRLMDVPRPRSLLDVHCLMEWGVSIVIRSAEQHDRGTAALAERFSHILPGEVHVQLYITPGQTNSYGWHYDFEDVFIAQTAGVKDYYFRPNTVARAAVLGDRLDFSLVSKETSPTYCVRLIPGDWLYIPATWWHIVMCVENALSISVGIMPLEALKNASRLPPGWAGMEKTR